MRLTSYDPSPALRHLLDDLISHYSQISSEQFDDPIRRPHEPCVSYDTAIILTDALFFRD